MEIHASRHALEDSMIWLGSVLSYRIGIRGLAYSSQKLVGLFEVLQQDGDVFLVRRPFHVPPEVTLDALHLVLYRNEGRNVSSWGGRLERAKRVALAGLQQGMKDRQPQKAMVGATPSRKYPDCWRNESRYSRNLQ